MVKPPELPQPHEQSVDYWRFALELMASGTDQAMKSLSAHIHDCNQCKQAQEAELRAMKLDANAQREFERL